jgi:hypothetical protein
MPRILQQLKKGAVASLGLASLWHDNNWLFGGFIVRKAVKAFLGGD